MVRVAHTQVMSPLPLSLSVCQTVQLTDAFVCKVGH